MKQQTADDAYLGVALVTDHIIFTSVAVFPVSRVI